MGGTFLIFFFFLFNVENPTLNLKGLYHPEKNEDEVWIARPSCLVRERRSLQPWWGIHIHNFLLDRKTCKVLCISVSRYCGLEIFVDCYIHSCCCVLLFGGAGKENTKEKSRAIGIGHSGSLDYWLIVKHSAVEIYFLDVFVSIWDKGGHSSYTQIVPVPAFTLAYKLSCLPTCAEKLHIAVSLCFAWEAVLKS